MTKHSSVAESDNLREYNLLERGKHSLTPRLSQSITIYKVMEVSRQGARVNSNPEHLRSVSCIVIWCVTETYDLKRLILTSCKQ